MLFSSHQSDAPSINPVMTSSVNARDWLPGSSRSILFVDRSVTSYQSLLTAEPGVEIKVLDSSQDALTQITETLAGRHGIESIQILSHGTSGVLYLGQDFLTTATLSQSAQQIQSWQQALTADADILLYGCNVGSGSIGQAFLQNLSQLTGADVAASDNVTGAGGDWILESTTGTIEAKIALNAIGMANYQASLNAPLWAQGTGGSGSGEHDSGNAIAVDGAGNTYITGKLQGSNISFGGSNISTKDGSPDAFVTKLDASGNFLWTKTFAGSSALIPSVALDVGQGITVDGDGNAYVIGSFQGTMNLGNFSLTSNGILDVFVLKLNGNDGSVVWGKNFGGDGIEQGFAIGLDSSNNAYITGMFGDISRSLTATFGGVTLNQNGKSDAFIAKLNGGNGDVVWAKSFGGSGNDTGYGVRAAAGGVYVTGNTENSGNYNVFALKLDSSNGNTVWNKNFGGAAEDTAKGISVDSSGNAYLTGFLKSATASFDNISVQSSGTNVFAAKLNSGDGSVAWVKSFGGSGEEYGNGIDVDGNGNAYIAGYFTSATWDLGTTVLTRTGNESADIFTLKLNGTDGSLTWAKKFGGDSFESAYGIAVDSVGNAFLTGEFFSGALPIGSTNLSPKGGLDLFVTKLDNVDPIDQEATGTLSVTGTAQEGGSLTANLTNVVDADGATTTAYRWQVLNGSTWTNIAGQTTNILNIASDQSMVGKQVRVIATTTDVLGSRTEFIGTTQTILNVDDAATGTLAVTGTAIVGGSLSASLTAVADPDGATTITYRWQELLGSTWTDIVGQTSATFSIVNNAANVGKQVRVIATTTDPFNGKTNFTSTAQTIAPATVTDREATGTLSVTGTAQEGGSLTANLTNVVDADGTTTTTYRWQVLNGSTWTNITGQTTATLNIASDQSMVGQQVRVIATTTDTLGGTTEFIGTAQTILNVDDAASGILAISGTAQQGNTINAVLVNLVDLDGTPIVTYQWQELSGTTWTNISGATTTSLALNNVSFVGKTVRVIATTTDPLGGISRFTSFETVITAATVTDREATGTLSVTGTAQEGGSLTANLTNVVDADGTTTTAYRWQVLNGSTWTNITGQTTATLNIASDQSMVGQQVRVIATTTDTLGGTTEFIGTAQTILNVDDAATGNLSITGISQQGNTLSAVIANLVDLDGTPTIAYRWQELSGTTWINISGATTENLVLNNATFVGKTVRVIATTTDPLGGTSNFTSAQTTITAATTGDREATGTLSVTGFAVEGGILTANLTNVVDADGATTIAYRWQVLNSGTWSNLSGQTNAAFNIASDQSMVGKNIRVIATTTDALGGTTEFIGNSQLIANVDDEATGTLSVTGNGTIGGSLTANLTNVVDEDGTIVRTYRWQEFTGGAWRDIEGSTSAVLSIANNASLVGQQRRVIVTTTDVLGGTTTFTSDGYTIGAAPTPSKVPDYNGDGKADLLWRNSVTGQNVIWYLNGNKFVGNSAPSATATDTNYNRREGTDYDFLAPIPDQTWQIVGQADFNNDGKTDVLWRNNVSGVNVIWYLDGKNFVGTGKNVLSSDLVRGRDYEIILRVADVSWKIEGVGDFNGDGKTDVLWRNSRSGQNVIWYLRGNNFAENSVGHQQGVDYAFLQTVADQNWKIEAVGEFNGDQKDDIVWRNDQAGLNVIWYSNTANFMTSDSSNTRVEGVSYDFLRPVNDPNWQIELATDINGDGKTDLVWRNYVTGQNVVWYLDGKQIIQSPSSPTPIQGEGYDFFFTVPDSTWRLGDVDVV